MTKKNVALAIAVKVSRAHHYPGGIDRGERNELRRRGAIRQSRSNRPRRVPYQEVGSTIAIELARADNGPHRGEGAE